MLRFPSSATPLVLALASTAASAGNYSATPVARGAAVRINGSDIAWTCGADACQGSTDESRPLVLCQDLASRAGRLTSFLVNGSAFTPAQLDRCNAKARGEAPLARVNWFWNGRSAKCCPAVSALRTGESLPTVAECCASMNS